MKKLIFTLYLAALCAVYGNAQTTALAWSSTSNYNVNDQVSVTIPNTTTTCTFICTQPQQNQPYNADPSNPSSGWAWAVYYDGTTINQFIPGGYEYKAGSKVYLSIDR